MILRRPMLLAGLLFGAALAGCSTGNGSTTPANNPVAQLPTGTGINGSGLVLAKTMVIPQWPANKTGTYDIMQVDPAAHNLYLADRTSNALDVFSTTALGLSNQIPGPYAGVQASPDISGPDGVVSVPGTPYVYVGDVDSVKVVDVVQGKTVAIVPTPNGATRSDEGCYDRDDNVLMFAAPAAGNVWIISANGAASAVRGEYTYPTPVQGLEQCAYDPGTKKFFLNNDGTADVNGNPVAPYPNGSLDTFVAATAAAGKPQAVPYLSYSTACFGPTGMALGPGGQLAIGCDAPAGQPQQTVVVSTTTPKFTAIIPQVGGSDMVYYDPHFNRYYTASRRWTANGISAGGAGPFTPVVGVINAATNTWIANIPAASGVHAVAADPNNGNVFVPAAGGIAVYTATNGTF